MTRLPPFGSRLALRIGLLGGSFNPAHEGHLHISREALKRLHLDEVWWLVSPRNPLKESSDLEEYAVRLGHARQIARDPRIRVLDVEQRQGLYYTIDSLRYLSARYPTMDFVWLMGADNLAGFHRWRNWRDIAQAFPIAILDRAPYALKALAGPFARSFSATRMPASAAPLLASSAPPCWLYLSIPRHPMSATHLRKTLGKNAFLRHTEPS